VPRRAKDMQKLAEWVAAKDAERRLQAEANRRAKAEQEARIAAEMAVGVARAEAERRERARLRALGLMPILEPEDANPDRQRILRHKSRRAARRERSKVRRMLRAASRASKPQPVGA
jgi:hypothetical protein